VLFDGGLDAGIAIIPEPAVKLATRIVPLLRRVPTVTRALPFGAGSRLERELQDAAAYTSRGFRILFDKDGIAERFFSLFPVPAAEASPQPTSAEFEATINDFWFNAIWTAKHIWRGELWRARSVGLEGSMRNALLKMIEWHARATSDGPLDTWEGGRFIEEWAGAEVLSELRHSLAGYDPAESQRALDSMMRLFARLSAESAGILGYDHQPDPGRRVIAWIDQFRPG
jgi:aminoglycoside 6-adenylyltransferase